MAFVRQEGSVGFLVFIIVFLMRIDVKNEARIGSSVKRIGCNLFVSKVKKMKKKKENI